MVQDPEIRIVKHFHFIEWELVGLIIHYYTSLADYIYLF